MATRRSLVIYATCSSPLSADNPTSLSTSKQRYDPVSVPEEGQQMCLTDDYLTIGFAELERLFTEECREYFAGSGCVCVCGLIVNEKLYIANLGDCRAVVFDRSGRSKALSKDHTPVDNSCESYPCLMRNGKQLRVAGQLNVTRAFGDS